MQVKQMFPKLKKDKTDEKDLFNYRIKKKKINNESIEFKKIYILGPTINISNKECFIFKPLNTDLNSVSKKRKDKLLNSNKDIISNINPNDEDIFLNKAKIKVRLIKTPKDRYLNNDKNPKAIKYEVKKIYPKKENKKTLIFNYSCFNNQLNNSKQDNLNTFKSLNYNLECRSNKFQKNNNTSYSNYFIKQYENAHKLSAKRNDLMNYIKKKNKHNNKEEKEIKKYIYKSQKFLKNNNFKSVNYIEIKNINNLKLDDISHISPINTERDINQAHLTKKNYTKSTNSLKSQTKEIIINANLNLVKNNNRNNENSLNSKKYNNIQKTYQKKFIKKRFIKIDNDYFNNKNVKSHNQNKLEKENNISKIDIINKFNNTSYNFNSQNNILKKISIDNFGLNSYVKKNILPNDKTKSPYFNKYFYNNPVFCKEKDETKYQTEQNFLSDNNYSTSNSFYIQKNKNNSISKKLMSSIKLEKKLKNIITSIDYKNSNDNNNKETNNNSNNKNIILYEFDKDGNINYKIKEMKNSVEKIVKEKSNSKFKKTSSHIYEISPDSHDNGVNSLYVKKNQGTVLRKTKNKMDFYNPYVNKLI